VLAGNEEDLQEGLGLKGHDGKRYKIDFLFIDYQGSFAF